MTETEHDEPPAPMKRTKARKSHLCDVCWEWILGGDHYYKGSTEHWRVIEARERYDSPDRRILDKVCTPCWESSDGLTEGGKLKERFTPGTPENIERITIEHIFDHPEASYGYRGRSGPSLTNTPSFD